MGGLQPLRPGPGLPGPAGSQARSALVRARAASKARVHRCPLCSRSTGQSPVIGHGPKTSTGKIRSKRFLRFRSSAILRSAATPRAVRAWSLRLAPRCVAPARAPSASPPAGVRHCAPVASPFHVGKETTACRAAAGRTASARELAGRNEAALARCPRTPQTPLSASHGPSSQHHGGRRRRGVTRRVGGRRIHGTVITVCCCNRSISSVVMVITLLLRPTDRLNLIIGTCG